MLKLIVVAILLVGISFAGIAIKMFFIEGASFKKSCSSVNPQTGESTDCSCGGGENSCSVS